MEPDGPLQRLPTPGFHALTRPQLIWTIIGLQFTLLLAALDQTIVTTAMPSIIAQLNGFDRYAWVTTAYLLCSTTALPIFGKLADLYGRKWIFLGGAGVFVLASALCGLAGAFGPLFGGGMNQVIVFRGLQGLASGAIFAISFTVVADIAPPAERGKYLGFLSAVFGLASVFGPTLGGWITDQLSWRWVFYVNLPVGAVAMAVVFFAFPYFRPENARRVIDYGGALTLAGCLVPLLLALTWVTDDGWTAPRVYLLLIGSAAMLAVFLFVESRAAEPILPLPIFRDPAIRIALATMFLSGVGMFAAVLFMPLFLQVVTGVSPTQSGSLLTPLTMMMVVGSLTSGQLASRVGHYKVLALVGLALATVGMFALSRMDVDTAQGAAVVNMMLVGLGMGLLTPIYLLVVQNAVPAPMLGAATASCQFFRTIGATIGAAVSGSIMLSRYTSRLNSQVPAGPSNGFTEAFRNPLRLAQMPKGVADVYLSCIKDALVFALDGVFVIGALVLAAAFVLNFFLRESPNRHGHGQRQQPEALPERTCLPSLEVTSSPSLGRGSS
jgi:EmrB/QacA subfamily drug resistance transporter